MDHLTFEVSNCSDLEQNSFAVAQIFSVYEWSVALNEEDFPREQFRSSSLSGFALLCAIFETLVKSRRILRRCSTKLHADILRSQNDFFSAHLQSKEKTVTFFKTPLIRSIHLPIHSSLPCGTLACYSGTSSARAEAAMPSPTFACAAVWPRKKRD